MLVIQFWATDFDVIQVKTRGPMDGTGRRPDSRTTIFEFGHDETDMIFRSLKFLGRGQEKDEKNGLLPEMLLFERQNFHQLKV